MPPKKSTIELLTPRPPDGWKAHAGDLVVLKDKGAAAVYVGTVRLKEVRCGKPNCHRCPHHIYAYAQFRKGNKVTEKYLGVAR